MIYACVFLFFIKFAEAPFLDMEIVACSGYGKNGAISVLQVSL
jgi:hypothetical protein